MSSNAKTPNEPTSCLEFESKKLSSPVRFITLSHTGSYLAILDVEEVLSVYSLEYCSGCVIILKFKY